MTDGAMRLEEAAENLQAFQKNGSLRSRISDLERSLAGIDRQRLPGLLEQQMIGEPLLQSALLLKLIAGQVNVVIHAMGIMLTLPHILLENEVVEYVSLGAGNTGKDFDLATNQRVAEFKLINWRGGAEAIRQNQLFKDLFCLAEHETDRKKLLYLVGTEHALKFLQGNRTVDSVLIRHNALRLKLRERYGDSCVTVNDYYRQVRDKVQIVDLKDIVPEFRRMPVL